MILLFDAAVSLLAAALGEGIRSLPTRRLRWMVRGRLSGMALRILGGLALRMWWNDR